MLIPTRHLRESDSVCGLPPDALGTGSRGLNLRQPVQSTHLGKHSVPRHVGKNMSHSPSPSTACSSSPSQFCKMRCIPVDEVWWWTPLICVRTILEDGFTPQTIYALPQSDPQAPEELHLQLIRNSVMISVWLKSVWQISIGSRTGKTGSCGKHAKQCYLEDVRSIDHSIFYWLFGPLYEVVQQSKYNVSDVRSGLEQQQKPNPSKSATALDLESLYQWHCTRVD